MIRQLTLPLQHRRWVVSGLVGLLVVAFVIALRLAAGGVNNAETAASPAAGIGPGPSQAAPARRVPTPGTIVFHKLSATSGPDAPASGSQPFWVQSFRPTQLWSGQDANATGFGVLPVWSYLQVLEARSGARLFVRVAATGNVAYVDRADVGPSGPPPARLSGEGVRTVLVQPGDTVLAISRRFGVSVDDVIAANHLNADAFIKAGQVLLIPASR